MFAGVLLDFLLIEEMTPGVCVEFLTNKGWDSYY
jgi:hypothetical protein